MKKKIYSLLLAFSTLFAVSCDLDLLENPNAVTAETASPDLLLNNIQLGYQGFFNTVSDAGMRLTRMLNQGSATYENAYIPLSTNGYWTGAYAGVLADINFLEPLAEEANFQRHLGIAKTIKAMVLMHLVDSYGDVPYSEALDASILNPNIDSGEEIYSEALRFLQEAKVHFTTTPSAGSPNDYFYGGDYTKWTRLVNTMMLRLNLNTKLVDPSGSASGINALVAEDNFLKTGDDFAFRFGTTSADPDSRHPRFAASYTNGGGDYMSTWYMFHVTEAKGFDDPRARFYFYRQQTTNTTDADELRCIGEIAPGHYLVGGFPFCLPGERGYWGRDHLNAEGIPPDGLKRTVWGLYPAGGRFDDDSGTPTDDPQLGNRGAGIHPIMLASYVDFMLAEAFITMDGVSGDAKAALESGIQKHMDYVRDFAEGSAESAVVSDFYPSEDYEEDVEGYIEYVLDEWDSSPEDRMFLIGREYWLALWGNGIESYNLYRRTGQPEGMQPGLEANFGDFPRSFFYPNNYMVTNTNAVQKSDQQVQVFWDTNPAGNAWVY